MRFSAMLKEAREKAGLSQAALAKKAGLPLRSLQNWEQERRVPRLPEAVKLARAVGVPPGDLLAALAEQVEQRRRKKRRGGDRPPEGEGGGK
jgi:transcriptional regulator with XRE-family HTH domain